MNQRQRVLASFIVASRSDGTISAHKRKIRDLADFMKETGATTVTETLLLAFLLECHMRQKPFGYWCQVKGAIFTLLIALYGDTYYWTPRVERVLEACKRIEAPNRQHR